VGNADVGQRNWHLRVIHFKSIWEGSGDLVFQNNRRCWVAMKAKCEMGFQKEQGRLAASPLRGMLQCLLIASMMTTLVSLNIAKRTRCTSVLRHILEDAVKQVGPKFPCSY